MPLNKASQAINLIQSVAPNVSTVEAARLAPILINQNNQEPWYLSKVTWGAIAAILGGLGTMAALFSTGNWSIEAWIAAVGSVYGGVQTLWGRWAAKVELPTYTDAEALAHNNAMTGRNQTEVFRR